MAIKVSRSSQVDITLRSEVVIVDVNEVAVVVTVKVSLSRDINVAVSGIKDQEVANAGKRELSGPVVPSAVAVVVEV